MPFRPKSFKIVKSLYKELEYLRKRFITNSYKFFFYKFLTILKFLVLNGTTKKIHDIVYGPQKYFKPCTGGSGIFNSSKGVHWANDVALEHLEHKNFKTATNFFGYSLMKILVAKTIFIPSNKDK